MNTIQDQLTAAEAAIKSGNYAEAETLCRQLLAQDLPSEEKARGLLHLSESLWFRGLAQEALPFAQQAFSIAEELEQKELQAKALGNIGIVYAQLSDYPRTLEYLHQALAINEELDNKSGVAIHLGNISNVYLQISDYPRALEYYHQALAIAEELGNKSGVAIHLSNIGIVYIALSDYPRALDYYHQALAINEELGNRSGMAGNLGNIGLVYDNLSDYARALEYYHQALAINEELGNKSGVATNLGNIGNVYYNLLGYTRALEYFHQALAINEELGRKDGVTRNLGNLGNVYKELSDYPRALDYYHQALAQAEELGNKSGVATNLGNIGGLYANSDFSGYNPAQAEEYLLQSIRISQELGTKRHLYYIHKSLADLYKQQDRWQEHAEYLQRYYDVRDEVQNEEAQKLADKFAFERQIAVMEKEREVMESSSLEIMRAYSVIQAEKERSDALLLNILPHSIAERIKQGERMIADPFDSVSIFFADIVGFTVLSTKISATELIALLNTIFITMDRIATEYNIEKIKTIGDSYMAVSGLPVPNINHAYSMAMFAKSVLTEVKSLDGFVRNNIDMRIGIHCGSVVAGIIGEHKFSYDIWGDSVNTASRMESHGEAGKIHISEDFKHALAEYEEFTFIPREPMFIKGKGLMNTYFLQ